MTSSKLWAFERRWAQAALEGFAPPSSPGLAPRPGEVDYFVAIEGMMRGSTGLASWGLRFTIWMVAFAPAWLCGSFRTIASLPIDDRASLLDRMLQHRVYLVRELTLLLKLTACFAMFASAALRSRSAYDRRSRPDSNARELEDVEEVEESGERAKLPRLPIVTIGKKRMAG